MNIFTNEEEALRLALYALKPDAKFGMLGLKLTNWDTSIIMPSQEEIDNKILELKDNYNLLEYSRLREIEYAKLNQDEMRFDDLENGTDLWREAIRAIKLAIPKP